MYSWFKQLSNPLPEQQEHVEDKIILVGGSVFKLKEELEERQHGDLTIRYQGKSCNSKAGEFEDSY